MKCVDLYNHREGKNTQHLSDKYNFKDMLLKLPVERTVLL